jgi:ribosomal-protein-alanine N-acetyltransferase
MAALHARAFVHERGWSACEFADLLALPHTQAHVAPAGFAVARTLAGETELLTLAVDPDHHRCGTGSALVAAWITAARADATTAFLEVAADNQGALALYGRHGFAPAGVRKAYYARARGTAVDAVMMTRALTRG